MDTTVHYDLGDQGRWKRVAGRGEQCVELNSAMYFEAWNKNIIKMIKNGNNGNPALLKFKLNIMLFKVWVYQQSNLNL